MHYTFYPQGVCSRKIELDIENGRVHNIHYLGGCNGNLSGIGILIKGMNINDIVPKLSGLHCGSRPTSCPDQLTKGIEAYLRAKSEVNV